MAKLFIKIINNKNPNQKYYYDHFLNWIYFKYRKLNLIL